MSASIILPGGPPVDPLTLASHAERYIESRPRVFVREAEFVESGTPWPCEGRKLRIVYRADNGPAVYVASTGEPQPPDDLEDAAFEHLQAVWTALAHRFMASCPGRFTREATFLYEGVVGVRLVLTPSNVRHLFAAPARPLCSWRLTYERDVYLLMVNGEPMDAAKHG